MNIMMKEFIDVLKYDTDYVDIFAMEHNYHGYTKEELNNIICALLTAIYKNNNKEKYNRIFSGVVKELEYLYAEEE